MDVNMLPPTMLCEDCGGDRFEVSKQELRMGEYQVRVSCARCTWTIVLPKKSVMIVKCSDCSVAHIVRGHAA